MCAKDLGSALAAMIGGESAMDLYAMRRMARELSTPETETDCRELIEAVELLDLAVLHGLPETLVAKLRADAATCLERFAPKDLLS
ncbi:MAG: hypothetical protein DI629_16595 [Mesorhizobium amorphae]|nr:MAG: hypothetical protein DI629_16595 [Mesorhizobium amorphae]